MDVLCRPLLDRIDLHVDVPIVDFRELSSDANIAERSATGRERVAAARGIQRERFEKTTHFKMPPWGPVKSVSIAGWTAEARATSNTP